MRDSPGLVKEKKKIPDKIAAIMRLWNGNDEILTASEPIGRDLSIVCVNS